MEIEQINTDTLPGIFSEVERLGHEQVVYCYDKATSLKAIIAIHDTTLGPALGGVRVWNYASERGALVDALRLSRGMTFKSSISGLDLGGGKAVIKGDARVIKNEALLYKFGEFVQSLGGKYITASDVNTGMSDMQAISRATKYVTGLPSSVGGGGSPAPATAYGTYMGIKAAAKKAYGTDNLSGKKIAVQGVGHVGKYLVEHLAKEGARIVISDMSAKKVEEVAKQFNTDTIEVDEVYDLDMDIYAPCALGASLNDEVIDKLRCSVVAGSANNQLKNETLHSQMLKDRGILYAPDFVVNAGGIVNVYHEYLGKYDGKKVYSDIERIYDVCINIFDLAETERITTHKAAMQIAKKRLAEAKKATAKN